VSESNLAPWLKHVYQRLQAQFEQGRLPHALLMYGVPGMGLPVLAQSIADLILPNAEQHPDFVRLCPNEGESVIKVDAVRTLIHKVQQTAHQSGAKVALIEPMSALNIASFNAILKTLEEPPKETYFILLARHPGELPKTIVSRCQNVPIPSLGEQEAFDFVQSQLNLEPDMALNLLKYAQNAPFQAIEAYNNGEWEAFRAFQQALKSVLSSRICVVDFAAEYAEQPKVFEWMILSTQAMIQAQNKVAYHQNLKALLSDQQGLKSNLNRTLLLEAQVIELQNALGV